MKLRLILSCVCGLALMSGACSGDDAEVSSTTAPTTTGAPVTSLQAAESTSTSTAAPVTSSTTTLAPFGEPSFPKYSIVSREAGEDGDTVVVLLDKDSYGSLTDIDLQNVLVDIVEKFPPILTAHIIDDSSAADAVLVSTPTEAEQELLDRYYLVRLEEGFRMVFSGPFADTPTTILGS